MTLIERKSRVPQLQGVQGWASTELSRSQAVVVYREPLATQKMGWHRLSRRWGPDGLYLSSRREMRRTVEEETRNKSNCESVVYVDSDIAFSASSNVGKILANLVIPTMLKIFLKCSDNPVIPVFCLFLCVSARI